MNLATRSSKFDCYYFDLTFPGSGPTKMGGVVCILLHLPILGQSHVLETMVGELLMSSPRCHSTTSNPCHLSYEMYCDHLKSDQLLKNHVVCT